jgi:Tol biopolymer transport system component
MKRRLVLVTGLAALALAGVAQQPGAPVVPLVRPTMTVLGTIRDTTHSGERLPTGAMLSPNGNLIKFNTNHGGSRIWNVAARHDSVVLAGVEGTQTWGPKGDVIAFSRNDPAARDKYLWTIRVDPATGQALEPPRRVGMHPIRYAPRFSPDQRLIAYPRQSSTVRFAYELAVVPANGGPERVLATGIDLGSSGFIADGSAITYGVQPDSTQPGKLRFRVPVSGGAPTRLREVRLPPGAVGETVWDYRDPVSGETIAALAIPAGITVTDWSGSNQIVGIREIRPRGLSVVNLADGKIQQLIDTTGTVGVPEWFADGERLATFVLRNNQISLSIVNVAGGLARNIALTRLPTSVGIDRNSAYLQVSPDGRYAVFRARAIDDDDDQTIELVDLASGSQRTLIRISADAKAPEGRGIGQLVWSADSKRVRYVYSIWEGEGRSVREVTLDGADKLVRALPRSAFPANTAWFPTSTGSSPMIDADVMELFGGPNVSLVPLSGGNARVVYANPVRGAGAISPDRQMMVLRSGALFSREPTGPLTVVSLGNLQARDITLRFIQASPVYWHPDGRRVLMLGHERPGSPPDLYSVPVNGDAPTVVARVPTHGDGASLAVSPNGRYVAVTVARPPSAEFVKLEFDVSAALRQASNK